MNDSTNHFHHIEVHTVRPNHLLDLFERVYGFQVIARRDTVSYRQWLLKSSQCRLVISSVSEISNTPHEPQHYDILTSILDHAAARNFIFHRDTVFNVALAVKSVQSILDRNPHVQVIHPRVCAIYGGAHQELKIY